MTEYEPLTKDQERNLRAYVARGDGAGHEAELLATVDALRKERDDVLAKNTGIIDDALVTTLKAEKERVAELEEKLAKFDVQTHHLRRDKEEAYKALMMLGKAARDGDLEVVRDIACRQGAAELANEWFEDQLQAAGRDQKEKQRASLEVQPCGHPLSYYRGPDHNDDPDHHCVGCERDEALAREKVLREVIEKQHPALLWLRHNGENETHRELGASLIDALNASSEAAKETQLGGICPDCKHYHSQHDKKYGCTVQGCECLRLS